MVCDGVHLRQNDPLGCVLKLLPMIQKYVQKMMSCGRFASIVEDGKAVLLMFYSICNDPQPYLDNLEHQYLEHDPSGTVLVIEEMTCKKFQKRYVSKIQEMMCEKYPKLEKGMWRRRREGREDKIYTLWRSLHEVQH